MAGIPPDNQDNARKGIDPWNFDCDSWPGNESYFLLNVQRNIVKSKGKRAPLLRSKFNKAERLCALIDALQ